MVRYWNGLEGGRYHTKARKEDKITSKNRRATGAPEYYSWPSFYSCLRVKAVALPHPRSK
jgi:hypothetical protein